MQTSSLLPITSCLLFLGTGVMACSQGSSTGSSNAGSTSDTHAGTGGSIVASDGGKASSSAMSTSVAGAGGNGSSSGGQSGVAISSPGGGGAMADSSVSRGGASSAGGLSTSGSRGPGGSAPLGGSAGGTSTARIGGTTIGGQTVGGSSTGGSSSSSSLGGASVGGRHDGGVATGGTSGSGTASGSAKPTEGCGKSTFPASGKYNIDVGGTQRSYIIKLPTGFDNSKPFRLVMTWHGLGGSAERTANAGYEGDYYGLAPLAGGQAIFTSGQGLSDSMGTGWANTNGQDVKYVKALVDYLRKTYCIDDSRIFSVGKSYGGLFSNTLGCAMGDVFRAIAPQSSWLETANPTCVGQTAVWIDHGNTDTTIQFSRGQAARDLFLKNNKCKSTTKPWDQPATTCVEYDGCDPDKTVIWCEFSGGHVMPSWASEAVWKFLMQF